MVEEENNLVFVLIGEYELSGVVIFSLLFPILKCNHLFVATLQMKSKALLLLERLPCLVLNLQTLYGYLPLLTRDKVEH